MDGVETIQEPPRYWAGEAETWQEVVKPLAAGDATAVKLLLVPMVAGVLVDLGSPLHRIRRPVPEAKALLARGPVRLRMAICPGNLRHDR